MKDATPPLPFKIPFLFPSMANAATATPRAFAFLSLTTQNPIGSNFSVLIFCWISGLKKLDNSYQLEEEEEEDDDDDELAQSLEVCAGPSCPHPSLLFHCVAGSEA